MLKLSMRISGAELKNLNETHLSLGSAILGTCMPPAQSKFPGSTFKNNRKASTSKIKRVEHKKPSGLLPLLENFRAQAG